MEFSAPPPPDSAAELVPKAADSFGEGLWNVVSAGLKLVSPSMSEAAQCCLRLLGADSHICLLSGNAIPLHQSLDPDFLRCCYRNSYIA
jgi:hypothetical protein